MSVKKFIKNWLISQSSAPKLWLLVTLKVADTNCWREAQITVSPFCVISQLLPRFPWVLEFGLFFSTFSSTSFSHEISKKIWLKSPLLTNCHCFSLSLTKVTHFHLSPKTDLNYPYACTTPGFPPWFCFPLFAIVSILSSLTLLLSSQLVKKTRIRHINNMFILASKTGVRHYWLVENWTLKKLSKIDSSASATSASKLWLLVTLKVADTNCWCEAQIIVSPLCVISQLLPRVPWILEFAIFFSPFLSTSFSSHIIRKQIWLKSPWLTNRLCFSLSLIKVTLFHLSPKTDLNYPYACTTPGFPPEFCFPLLAVFSLLSSLILLLSPQLAKKTRIRHINNMLILASKTGVRHYWLVENWTLKKLSKIDSSASATSASKLWLIVTLKVAGPNGWSEAQRIVSPFCVISKLLPRVPWTLEFALFFSPFSSTSFSSQIIKKKIWLKSPLLTNCIVNLWV